MLRCTAGPPRKRSAKGAYRATAHQQYVETHSNPPDSEDIATQILQPAHVLKDPHTHTIVTEPGFFPMEENYKDSFTLLSQTSSSTAFTPASTCSSEGDESGSASASSIPWQHSTYIIQNVSTGKVISYGSGRVYLAKVGGREYAEWKATEHDGWLGFQQPGSNKYLGYNRDNDHILQCSADKQNLWEYFCVRQRPDGNYMLLMPTYGIFTAAWQQLRPVGVCGETVKIFADWNHESTAWKFTKIS